MPEPDNKYTQLQKHIYDAGYGEWRVDARDAMVGTFDSHNQFEGYQFLFDELETAGKLALDFGCGPGRNLVKYHNQFGQIDGVDISAVSLGKAKEYLRVNKIKVPDLYLCNGVDLNPIKDDTYDVVFSTICLQHICVHEIRYNYFKEFFRVLKPGGTLTFQMGFGPGVPFRANYYDNYYDAQSTNGMMDTKVDSEEQLESDLGKIGFHDFRFKFTKAPSFEPAPLHESWIFTRCKKPSRGD